MTRTLAPSAKSPVRPPRTAPVYHSVQTETTIYPACATRKCYTGTRRCRKRAIADNAPAPVCFAGARLKYLVCNTESVSPHRSSYSPCVQADTRLYLRYRLNGASGSGGIRSIPASKECAVMVGVHLWDLVPVVLILILLAGGLALIGWSIGKGYARERQRLEQRDEPR